MSDLFERQLQQFFDSIGGGTHAERVRSLIGNYVAMMQQSPHVAARELHRFIIYFTDSPQDNVYPALLCIHLMAKFVPELCMQIRRDLGDVLYEYRPIMLGRKGQNVLEELLAFLEVPVNPKDQHLRDIARAIVTLHQPVVLVIGAGFSYDTMPITGEVAPLLVPLLRQKGVADPARLLRENDREAWRIAKQSAREFQSRFVGWSARSTPSDQHFAVSEMLHREQVTHVISFNWDNLIERAYFELFGDSIRKVSADGILPNGPALWKLHGDVEQPDEMWVFPYDEGRVFGSLMESLGRAIADKTPSYALIVGYSESEPEVKTTLMRWLDENVPNSLRVSPKWPEGDAGGIPDSAKRFFARLRIYMQQEVKASLGTC